MNSKVRVLVTRLFPLLPLMLLAGMGTVLVTSAGDLKRHLHNILVLAGQSRLIALKSCGPQVSSRRSRDRKSGMPLLRLLKRSSYSAPSPHCGAWRLGILGRVAKPPWERGRPVRNRGRRPLERPAVAPRRARRLRSQASIVVVRDTRSCFRLNSCVPNL